MPKVNPCREQRSRWVYKSFYGVSVRGCDEERSCGLEKVVYGVDGQGVVKYSLSSNNEHMQQTDMLCSHLVQGRPVTPVDQT